MDVVPPSGLHSKKIGVAAAASRGAKIPIKSVFWRIETVGGRDER
jgi:hypothetical protein